MTEIIIESQGEIELVYLNRPNSLNALNTALFKDLKNYFSETSSPAIILAGMRRAFCAGADIHEMSNMDLKALNAYLSLALSVMDAMASYSGLVVAAIHGYALGGGLELALACDWIIADEKCKMGMPEVELGLIPGFGGMQRLSQKIGLSKAKKLISTGEKISAEEAQHLGLIDEIVPKEKTVEYATKYCEKILPSISAYVAAKKVYQGKEDDRNAFLRLFFMPETQKKLELFTS